MSIIEGLRDLGPWVASLPLIHKLLLSGIIVLVAGFLLAQIWAPRDSLELVVRDTRKPSEPSQKLLSLENAQVSLSFLSPTKDEIITLKPDESFTVRGELEASSDRLDSIAEIVVEIAAPPSDTPISQTISRPQELQWSAKFPKLPTRSGGILITATLKDSNGRSAFSANTNAVIQTEK